MLKVAFVVNGKRGRKRRLMKEFRQLQVPEGAYEFCIRETPGVGDGITLSHDLAYLLTSIPGGTRYFNNK